MIQLIMLAILGILTALNAILTFGCWIDFRRSGREFFSYEHETAEAAAMFFCAYSTLLSAILFVVVWLK